MSLIDEMDAAVTGGAATNGRGRGKSLFLGQLDDIKAALDKGYNMKQVWRHLHDSDRMPVGYASFTNYVAAYVTSKNENSLANKIIQTDKNKSLPRGYNNAPKPSRFMDDDENMPSIYDSRDESKPLVPVINEKKSFNHKKKPDMSLLETTEDTEKTERLPRGLGTSSSVSHQRKTFKPDNEIQESELFNFDNR